VYNSKDAIAIFIPDSGVHMSILKGSFRINTEAAWHLLGHTVLCPRKCGRKSDKVWATLVKGKNRSGDVKKLRVVCSMTQGRAKHDRGQVKHGRKSAKASQSAS
jgi:hypothetical protein